MRPRVPTYVRRGHGAVIPAIIREPGDEYVTIRRSDVWADGWRAALYRGEGPDRDATLVALADRESTPTAAFEAALRQLRGEDVFACQCPVCPCREPATREGRDGPALCDACQEAHG